MRNWILNLILAVFGLLLSGPAIPQIKTEAYDMSFLSSSSISQWELTATVDLSGVFPVIADANIETSGSTFTANVTTKTIGGAVEVYNIPFSGTHNNGVYTVTNLPFDAVPGEEATINNLTFTIAGNDLTGSGTFTVIIPGVGTLPGTVELTGTKKGGNAENKEPEWVKQYTSGLLSANDRATDVACDQLGNIYVTGGSEGSPFSTDYLTIKYDPLGNILWNVRYDNGGNDDSKAIEVDSSGNVYITGRSWNSDAYYDIVTIKYNTSGEQLWLAKYNGTGNLYDEATDLVVDLEGNVYVTGKSEGEGVGTELNYDYVTIKYNQSGVEQWVKRFSGPGNYYDAAEAIALDHSGNVYVTGYSNTGTVYDYVTIKYNQAGVEQWLNRAVSIGNSHNDRLSIAIDGSDNLFIAGAKSGSGGYNDGITIKYNSDGDELWKKTYNGPGNSSDGINAIDVDGLGNIYVTGYSQGTGTGYDYATIKYNTDGVEQWVKRYNGTGNSGDTPSDISVDTSGNVYVTGYSEGLEASCDFLTINYDSGGNEKWVTRYNESGNSDEKAVAIVTDVLGNICVTGYGKTPETNYDYLTLKYNSEGGQQWVKRTNGTGNSAELASACVSDSSGNVYVTGWSDSKFNGSDFATLKYNPDGIVQWVARYNGPGNSLDHARDIAVDGLGNVYVTGSSSGTGSLNDYATVKYNSDGVEQWVARYNGPGNSFDDAKAIAVDASGNVYVTGMSLGSGTDNDFATIKYNSVGAEQWVKRYNGPGNNYDQAVAIAIDGSGNIIVTGPSTGSGTSYDYATIKYNPDGVEQWVKRYNGPRNSFDNAVDLAVDDLMNIYVTGNSSGTGTQDDYATIKYNSSGVEQWVKRYNGPGNSYDVASAIAVDHSGNAFVTGYSVGSGTGNDYATIKYNTAGVEQWVKRYNGPNNDNQDEASDIAIDDSSNVYVTGHCRSLNNRSFFTTTIMYNSNGIERWTAINKKTDNYYSWDPVITFGGFDNIYVSGSILNDNLSWSIYETIKYKRNLPVISVSPSDLTLAATAGSTNSFTVTSNTSWTATSKQTWLAVNPSNGNGNRTVTATAEANPLITTRSATITVSANGVVPLIINVTQLAGAATLSVSPTTLDLASAVGSMATLNVTSNTNWTVSDDQAWLMVNPASGSGNGQVTVTAEANSTTAPRTATVTVSATGVESKTVLVTQSAAAVTLSVSPNTLDIASAANSMATLNVTSNTNWTVSDDQAWLMVNPASGSGNGQVTVTAEANSTTTLRTASISISGTGVASKTIMVTQAAGAASLSVSPIALNVASAEGSTTTFAVTSNTGWTIASDQTWLTVNPATGTGNGTISLKAGENPTTSERMATITVSATGVASKTIMVTQAAGAASLSVSPIALNVASAEGSTTTFAVTSNTGWTIASDQTWLTVNPASGTGNGIITLTAGSNSVTTERTATITISVVGAASQTVSVKQAAATAILSVSPSNLEIGATEGSASTLNVTSNTSWTATSDQTWLTVNPATGTGDGVVTLTSEANPSTSERTAMITVSATGATLQTVAVTQAARVGIGISELAGLSVYPNPFSDGFYINSGDEATTISVFDIKGRKIITQTVSGVEFITAEKLCHGVYTIELRNNKMTLHKKLIKQ